MADQHITQNPHSSSAPQPNRIKNFDKQFPLLRSTYKNSLKLSISNSKETNYESSDLTQPQNEPEETSSYNTNSEKNKKY